MSLELLVELGRERGIPAKQASRVALADKSEAEHVA